jgi:amidophosphoribosyltransferase
MGDSLKDKCGVFGVYGGDKASYLTYLGLRALQHRGQESAGIVSSNGKKLYEYKGMGYVSDVFNDSTLKRLKCHIANGHVRYSTTGSSDIRNAQPLKMDIHGKEIAISHNGNLVNTCDIKRRLDREGSIFQTTTDSEVILHLVAKSKENTLEDAVIDSLRQVKGAYSLLITTKDKLIAVRDPHGFRPLCLGKNGNNSYVIASETCAFDLVKANYIRDIEPGELLIINDKGIHTKKPFKEMKHSFCIFELIYFARPDSMVFGTYVSEMRKNMGRMLANEHPVKADIVSPIPDSGNYAAIGYAQESGIPFDLSFTRNHYIGRTFIQPTQSARDIDTEIKLNPVKGGVKGKRVVVVEDSIVRGTTSRNKIGMLYDAGAKDVHMMISCPPHKFGCYYGIDFPTQDELIAHNKSIEDIRRHIKATSLGYLTIDSLLKSVSDVNDTFCIACFNGKYPVPIENKNVKARK